MASGKMANTPKSVGIIFKHDFEPAKRECQRLKDWFTARGIKVYTEEMTSSPALNQCLEEETIIPDTVDWVVVLGGDGTLLGAARKVGRYGPLKRLYKDIEKFVTGEITIETRLMLQASILRNNEEKCRFSVLNDVVINKGALARIVDLMVSIDGHFLTTFRADGLIISTPTGSTGYNLSAGGPIIYPDLEALILAPICPFTLTHRPIILSDKSVIEIEMGENSEQVTLTFDGQVGFDLITNDRVVISKSEKKLKLIKSPGQDYFDILRTKLKWGESSYNETNR
jgi:NAD+ kinase